MFQSLSSTKHPHHRRTAGLDLRATRVAIGIVFLFGPVVIPGSAGAAAPEIAWARQFGSVSSETVYGVAIDASGNTYVAGYTSGALPGQSSAGSEDGFVRKYDASGSVLWTRQFGTAASDVARGVAVDASGSVYLAGYTDGAFPGQVLVGVTDAFVRKYDDAGNEVWTRQFGSVSWDAANAVAVDASGYVFIAGQATGALPGQVLTGSSAAFVRKYDAAGNEVWTRQFGSSIGAGADGVAADASGNVLVAGTADGVLLGQTSSGSLDAFVRKYDAGGSELWTRQFGGGDQDMAQGMTADVSGDVYVVGQTGGLPGQLSAGGDRDAFVRKYGAAGNELWTRQFGSIGGDVAYGVAVDTGGSAYVTGYAEAALPGQVSLGASDAFVRVYDAAGGELWTRQFGSTTGDGAIGVAVGTSGSVLVGGGTEGALPGQTSAGARDAFLAKLAESVAGVACGDTITADTILDRDLTCPGDGLLIGADNVTLDLGGHTLAGPAAACTPLECLGYTGVSILGHSGITVRDGTLTGFALGVRVERAWGGKTPSGMR